MSGYALLVYVHVLLLVIWLGMDAAVFLLSRHFLKPSYSLDQRMVLLKMLTLVDMGPRTAWALMVPVSLWLVTLGGWWEVPPAILWASVIIAGIWLWLVWDAHYHDGTARAVRNRKVELYLKCVLAALYLALGVESVASGSPLIAPWLAWKAFLFGLIFVCAIMIDVAFRPLPGQLQDLLEKGSSDETERPIRSTLFHTSIWVWSVYLLLIATSFLGSVKA